MKMRSIATALLAMLLLTACEGWRGGSVSLGDNGGTDPNGDDTVTSNAVWDQIQWDQARWQ